MTAIPATKTSKYRAVRVWLLVVAGLIAAMVLVGGATRLTESGLSIVEWKPVTGVTPPLTQAQWERAFEAYQAIPQYRQLNAGMSLSQFKTIFWWEWSHRLLGRVIGVVYLLPFLYFLWRGGMSGELKRRLWLIFGLGALQGAVGWWMVASGLSERTEVSQYRLATHLVLALMIFAAIIWTVRRLGDERRVFASARLRATSVALVVLTLVQLYFGALVAGLRAGLLYNTWPDIDGGFVPAAARLWFDTPWWRNLFENALTVQFEHRMTAYALLALAVLHVVDAIHTRAAMPIIRGALWLAAVITLQATLGILTLLNQVPIGLALSHQAVAIAVLTLAVCQAERLSERQTGLVSPDIGTAVGQAS
jgi:heme a synthase